MICNQIYITGIKDAERVFQEDIYSFKKKYKEKYIFWDNEKIHDLLLTDNEHKKAYELVNPYAYKADLAKYLILHKFGGLVVDPGVFLIEEFTIKESALFLFCPPEFINNEAINNAFIYSIENNFIIEKIIEKTCFNILNKYYGNTPWDVTGPKLVYDCVMEQDLKNFKFGDTVDNDEYEPDRLYKFTIDNKTIALSKNIKTYNYRDKTEKTDYQLAWYSHKLYVD